MGFGSYICICLVIFFLLVHHLMLEEHIILAPHSLSRYFFFYSLDWLLRSSGPSEGSTDRADRPVLTVLRTTTRITQTTTPYVTAIDHAPVLSLVSCQQYARSKILTSSTRDGILFIVLGSACGRMLSEARRQRSRAPRGAPLPDAAFPNHTFMPRSAVECCESGVRRRMHHKPSECQQINIKKGNYATRYQKRARVDGHFRV